MYIDSHVHVSLDSKNRKSHKKILIEKDIKSIELIENVLESYKQRGIYILRDGGDNIGIASLVREIALDKGMIYKTPITAFYKRGKYGNIIGTPIDNISDFNEKFELIKYRKPDCIKIVLTGIVNFADYGDVGDIGFKSSELDYMIKNAKDLGLPVMVHVNSSEAVRMAIKSGADTIEHGYFMTKEDIGMIKENNAIWVPTLAPLGNIVYSNDSLSIEERTIVRKVLKLQMDNVKFAFDIGAKIAVGSDSGAFLVDHGSGFFDELMYLNKAGIDKKNLLRLAYTNGIDALKVTKSELNFIEKKME